MKKFFFLAAALTGLLAVSCNKEKEAPVAPEREMGPTHTVSIKASIAPGTRTSYADDKTFSWVEKDSIIVVTLSPDEDYIRLTTFYAQSSGPETVFTGEVEEGYTLYTMAFYTAAGSGVAFGKDDDHNIYFYLPSLTDIDGDSATSYTVESANPLANLPLIGVKQEDNSYVFFTAAGAAKFTFTDIPEGAAYFAIEYSDEPLSGYFTWDEEGVITNATAREGTYEYTGSDGETHTARYANRYVVYRFDRNEDGTGTIYMPLPVGRIPAGSKVSFYDEELEEVLYTRPIRSDIPITRNKVTEVASFGASYAWESIGTAAFYDLLPFYYMNKEYSNYAFVEMFQDPGMPGVYRLANPYPVAAEERGYTISDQYELPEYLTINILKDNSVIYDDFHTGYNEDDYVTAGYGDWFGGCPASWGEDNSYNFVAKYDENGDPEYVVLSPLYLFEGPNDLYYYAWDSDTWKNMWVEIYFPNAERQYYLSCSLELTEVVDDNPAAPYGAVTLELGSEEYGCDYAGADLVIAQDRESAEAMLAAGLGVRVTGSGEYEVPFPEEAPTGEYYAFAKTIPAEGFTENCALLFDSGDEFEYFRKDQDLGLTIEDIAGSYTGNNYYRTASSGWTNNPTDLTFVIEESDDPLSGFDIMFPELCPEIAKAIGGRSATVTAVPVYATFDTALGIVVIPAGQPAFTVKPRVGSEYTLNTGDASGGDIYLYWTGPGTLRNKTNIGLWKGKDLAGNTNRDTTFSRDGGNKAPARVARKFYGVKPFKAVDQSVTRYPGLDRTPMEKVPFTGERMKIHR